MQAIGQNLLCNCRRRTQFPQLQRLSSYSISYSNSKSIITDRIAQQYPLTPLAVHRQPHHLKISKTNFLQNIQSRNISISHSYGRETSASAYPHKYYVNMSSSHLAAGSECPALQEGKLRIYSMRYCPYAQRALLVAIAKGIPHDVVNVNLKEKPDWFLERNPSGKVPIIERPDGSVLYESLIVADYLDEVYSNRPLHSTDPFQKGKDRIWTENFNKVASGYRKVMVSKGDSSEQEGYMKSFTEALLPFEKELSLRGTKYFGGDDLPGMLDYMIWPWFERAPLLKVLFPSLYDYESGKQEYPNLEAWRKAMKEDPAAKEVYLGVEIHQQFAQGYRAGSINYDILEENQSKL